LSLSRRRLLGTLSGLPLLPLAARAVAYPAVDLALLMAVDASASIDRGILDLQLRGHAAAFRHPGVAQAALAGRQQRIAVQLVQFAGPDAYTTLVPWTALASPADCLRFAGAIDAAPGVAMGGSTALGNAIVSAVRSLDAAPFQADRRVVDLVSNGFNNAGIDPRSAAAHAAGAGVVVNGLAILNEYDWLEGYFADTLITGPGSFARSVEDPASFGEAFLAKLMAEIA
jgi:Ca-activated chloride channel homolog